MSNAATHKISLWIENTESLYQRARACIRDDMRAGRTWNAGTALCECFEMECDESSVNDFAWSILMDLMGEIDWNVIAESVWGDGEEDSDDDSEDESEDWDPETVMLEYDWQSDPENLLRSDV